MGTSVLRTGFRQTGANFIRAFTPGVLPSPQFQHLKAFPVRLQVRMVEGPQCHRVANVHRKVLKGHAFKAISPNQRFTEGARLINGQVLNRIEVHGKNLFYFFGEGPDLVVMHIHFGMSGRFRVSPLPGPESTPTTRLQLTNDSLGVVANLSAMTVQHGDLEFYEKQSGKIGPDPLREDADIELVWKKLNGSKKPVGLVLMDQSMVAGIGNIYRAEILFKAGVHPEQPGNTVDRNAFERIWRHSVLLLQRGFKEGSILTVDPAEAKTLGPPWTRRYIYNHPHCGRCKTAVGVWDMAARTVYACPTCQPLIVGTALTEARSTALGKAHPHKKFKSTCAPDGPVKPQPVMPLPEAKQLTVADLKSKLKSLGESTKGKKEELQTRLTAAVAKEATKEEAGVKVPAKEALLSAAEGTEEAGKAGESKDAPQDRRRSRRAAGKPAVKREASEEPAKKKNKRIKNEKAVKKEPVPEPEQNVEDNLSVEGLAVEGISVSGLLDKTENVPDDKKPPKRARRQSQKKPSSKAFDAVLEKEDREGPIVVTSAGEDAARPAPGLPEQDQWEGLTVVMLKHELQKRDLPTKGIKRTLVARLREAAEAEKPKSADIKPGTAGIDAVATREEAEEEKRRAGEGKNVEHVAL